MRAVTIIGVILMVIGVIGFVAKGITYTTEEEVVDIGPLEVQAEDKETIPMTPLASGVAFVAGAAMLVYTRMEQ